jgi:aminoglycoside phosphotransferase
MDLGSNGCFVTGATLRGDHYRTNIISSEGHSRLDLVVPRVLWMAAYNIGGTSVVLHVPRDSAMLRMSNISGRPYIRVMTYKTLVLMH